MASLIEITLYSYRKRFPGLDIKGKGEAFEQQLSAQIPRFFVQMLRPY
ncbi:MAG TPA: hypothetical protein V6D33_08280 [Cyanophyceae cyanobacterium]